MTIVSGTVLTYSAIGNREDLADTIYNISPKDTPFLAKAAKNTATATKHEWQSDTLAAAAANAQLEGDDFTFATPAFTTRCSNYCQISFKTVIVSGTQDAVNKAGRKREMVYQMTKRAAELRRDQEFVLLNNQTPVGSGANSTTARALASLPSWYSTNVQRGAGGASATGAGSAPTTAATDGTQRPLNESLMKAGLQAAWTQGGDVDLIMAGPFNKTVISSFSGNVSRIDDNSNNSTLNTTIDFYKSDFGTHQVISNRFQRERDLHLLTSSLWAVSTLRPMFTKDIAQTGDAMKGAIITEYTLECRQQTGSAIVADLTTS